MEKIESFKIIGLLIKTTNKNGKVATDIAELWKQFYAEEIQQQIPNVTCADIYSIYTDYESDYRGNYNVILGLKVSSLATIPDHLVGREFQGGQYKKFIAKGEMPNAVGEKWQEIWAKDKELNRKYTADFEVYGSKSQNGDTSEVEIFIAVE